MSVHVFQKETHPETCQYIANVRRRENERETLVFQGVWETAAMRRAEKSFKKSQKKSRKGVAIFTRVGYNIGVVC